MSLFLVRLAFRSSVSRRIRRRFGRSALHAGIYLFLIGHNNTNERNPNQIIWKSQRDTMNYLIRIHDYNKPTEDDELWHVLGNRHWKRLALGHGQLLGVLTSDESAFEIQSALAQHLEWPSRCLAVPIGQDSPPPRYK